jgi:outer membrane protein
MKKLFLLSLMMFIASISYAADVKIGYVNIQDVFLAYEETQSVNTILQGEKVRRQRELDIMQEEVRKEKEDFEKNINSYTKEEREKKEEELTEKLQELQGKLTESSVDLQELQKKEFEKLEVKIKEAIDKVAASEKVDYIIEKGVLYFGGYDLTEKVINVLNKK